MSALLLYFANQPDRLACVLGADGAGLVLDPSGHRASAGTGFYQGSEVLLGRRPGVAERTPWVPSEALANLRADALLAVVNGPESEREPLSARAPLRHRQWLFGAFLSPIPSPVRTALRARVPEHWMRNFPADSPDALAFAHVLHALDADGRVAARAMDAAGLAHVLRLAWASVDAATRECDASSLAGVLAVTDGSAFAVCARGQSVRWTRRRGLSGCAVCARAPVPGRRDRRAQDHPGLKSVLVLVGDDDVRPAEGVSWERTLSPHEVVTLAADRSLDLHASRAPWTP